MLICSGSCGARLGRNCRRGGPGARPRRSIVGRRGGVRDAEHRFGGGNAMRIRNRDHEVLRRCRRGRGHRRWGGGFGLGARRTAASTSPLGRLLGGGNSNGGGIRWGIRSGFGSSASLSDVPGIEYFEVRTRHVGRVEAVAILTLRTERMTNRVATVARLKCTSRRRVGGTRTRRLLFAFLARLVELLCQILNPI